MYPFLLTYIFVFKKSCTGYTLDNQSEGLEHLKLISAIYFPNWLLCLVYCLPANFAFWLLFFFFYRYTNLYLGKTVLVCPSMCSYGDLHIVNMYCRFPVTSIKCMRYEYTYSNQNQDKGYNSMPNCVSLRQIYRFEPQPGSITHSMSRHYQQIVRHSLQLRLLSLFSTVQ